MSNILDRVFNEVCLDERISDGIFRMDEEAHMEALRDYFIRKGITKEAAIHVTNRMVEGKYPDRQAWRKEDGILVTWPSPKHKAKAMAENPGKYTDQEPKKEAPPEKEPPIEKEPIEKEEPDEEEPEKKSFGGKSLPKSDVKSDGDSKISQGGKELEIEPPRGKVSPVALPPTPPAQPQIPRTPERIAAEKEVAKQIIHTDDSVLSNVADPLNLNEKALNHQLNELYKKADEWGFREAITFLTPYVKP